MVSLFRSLHNQVLWYRLVSIVYRLVQVVYLKVIPGKIIEEWARERRKEWKPRNVQSPSVSAVGSWSLVSHGNSGRQYRRCLRSIPTERWGDWDIYALPPYLPLVESASKTTTSSAFWACPARKPIVYTMSSERVKTIYSRQPGVQRQVLRGHEWGTNSFC